MNTPGLECLLTFHVYEKVLLNLVAVVFVESVTMPFTVALAIVKFEFAASRTVV